MNNKVRMDVSNETASLLAKGLVAFSRESHSVILYWSLYQAKNQSY